MNNEGTEAFSSIRKDDKSVVPRNQLENKKGASYVIIIKAQNNSFARFCQIRVSRNAFE
jgi:hypothetical protein